jgi:hypothetical protein
MPKRDDRLIEKKRWYRNTKTLLGLVAAVSAGVATIAADVSSIRTFFEHHILGWPQDGVEIVLDTSQAMARPFDANLTRMKVAAGVLSDDSTLPITGGTSVAFREFGGDCGAANSSLILGFARDNTPRIQDRLKGGVEAKGKSSLYWAVSTALDDFTGGRFKGRGQQLVVIWGGEPDCDRDFSGLTQQLDALFKAKKAADPGFAPDFRLIGSGIAPEEVSELRRLFGQNADWKFTPVENQAQLEMTLRRILVYEPLQGAIQQVLDHVNASVVHQNTFRDQMNNRDWSGALASLTAQEADNTEIQKSTSRAGDLRSRPEYVKLADLFLKISNVESQMTDVGHTMIDLGRQSNIQEFNARVEEYNKHVADRNQAAETARSMLQDLLNGRPPATG